MSGVLCVMTPGELMMLLWCADSWGTPFKVSRHNFNKIISLHFKLCLRKQMQWLSPMLTLVLVLVQSFGVTLAAVVVRDTSSTAHIAPLSAVDTMRMLE